MVWALLRLSAALVGSLTELFCPQRHVGLRFVSSKNVLEKSPARSSVPAEEHASESKSPVRCDRSPYGLLRVDRVRLPASTPLAKSSGPHGAAPPVPRSRALGTALQEPGSQALRRNRRASPGLHPRRLAMARDRFSSEDPRAPYTVFQGEEERGTYNTRAEARRRQQ
jgi:hypothetical protein